MAGVELNDLTPPATVWQKLEWIEVRGVPDYLYLPGQPGKSESGQQYIAYRPRDVAADRREIQAVYHGAFLQSRPALQKKVLRRYTANFPGLAFDQDSWLWPLWQLWRARYSITDRQLLAAVASGIRAKGWGWMSGIRARAWIVAQARSRVAHLGAKKEIKALYRKCLEGMRSKNVADRREYKERYGRPLIALIEQETGYRTSWNELKKRALSGVLRRAVSRAFGVRERNLH